MIRLRQGYGWQASGGKPQSRIRKPRRSILRSKTCVLKWQRVNTITIDNLMRDVDRTLLRENLKLTPAQRLENLVSFIRFASELRRSVARAREKQFGQKTIER